MSAWLTPDLQHLTEPWGEVLNKELLSDFCGSVAQSIPLPICSPEAPQIWGPAGPYSFTEKLWQPEPWV